MQKFKLVLKITNWCNLQCEHCIENSGPNQPYKLMPVEQIKKYIKEYKNIGNRITFTGGEPFASYIQERAEYIPAIAKICVAHKISPVFDTNGTWAENMYVGGIMMTNLSKIAQKRGRKIFLDIYVDKHRNEYQGVENICKLIARHQHLRDNIRLSFYGDSYHAHKIRLYSPYLLVDNEDEFLVQMSDSGHPAEMETKARVPFVETKRKRQEYASDDTNITDGQDVLIITNDNQAILNRKYTTTVDDKTLGQIYNELVQKKR